MWDGGDIFPRTDKWSLLSRPSVLTNGPSVVSMRCISMLWCTEESRKAPQCTHWPWPKTRGSEGHASLKYTPIFIYTLDSEQIFIFHQNALRFCLFKNDASLQMFVQDFCITVANKKCVLYALALVFQVSFLLRHKACLCIRLCTDKWASIAF